MSSIFFFLLFLCPQNGFSAVHWGLQQQNWPFPMQKHGVDPSPKQLKQIPLQPVGLSQSQQPPAPWNDYNEYLAKLTDYYNDYYSEYGSRYNEYLAKFSEWLKTSFGGMPSNGGSTGPPMPIPPEGGPSSGWITPSANGGVAGPTMPKIPFHRQRPSCPPKTFPPANKTLNANKNEPPKFAHPLVLPIIHGNFTAKMNPGADSNLTIADPFQQHLAMHSSVTVVVDHDSEGNKHIIVADTGLAVFKHAILNGLLSNGIQPHQVDTVCITHPDTDTMGNLNLFPCAETHSGNAISRENLFARQPAPQFESNRSDLPFRRLFVHSELYLTPGLSFQDQSLVVRNVVDHGTVAIVGKLILNEGDLANNLAIREFATEDSEHRKLWQATRREIVCMADYVVPGYGIPFKVSSEMKSLAECGANKKTRMPPFSAWGKKTA